MHSAGNGPYKSEESAFAAVRAQRSQTGIWTAIRCHHDGTYSLEHTEERFSERHDYGSALFEDAAPPKPATR